MKEAVSLYNTMTVKIPVETKQGVYTLPASAIIMIEAFGRKVIDHSTIRDFESIYNMQYWLELLPQNCFFQTHRSFIVNFEHIADFDHTLIHMEGGQFCAYLTKRKYSAFKEAYLLYLVLFAVSLYDFKWLNVSMYLLVNFIFLLTMYRLKWHSALFHSAVLTAIMSMCELAVYSIIGRFAPHFFTETTYSHNIILFAVFSKMAFFTVIHILIHFLREHQEINPQQDKYALLLVFIPLNSIFVMLIS